MIPPSIYQRKLPKMQSLGSPNNQSAFTMFNKLEAKLQIHLVRMNNNIENLLNLLGQRLIKHENNEDVLTQHPKNEANYKSNIQSESKKNFSKYFDEFERRFRSINVELPHKFSDQEILNWLGEVCKRVFSVGFTMFQNQELDYSKMKVFCSQNILRNIIYLSKQVHLEPKHFQIIDRCLKDNLLPYFCLKYPQTEEKEVSTKFQKLLIEKDLLKENHNDMCSRGNTNFTIEQDGNYNSQIMMFLNFIISLPGRLPGLYQNKQNKSLTLSQLFKNDMQLIFESIQSEATISQMINFQPKTSQKFDNIGLGFLKKIQISSKLQKEEYVQQQKSPKQLEYQEKIRSYTTFQIGQKLSDNLQKFSDYEIKSGNLRLNNSALMRVVTKWCSQLQAYFNPNEILNRESPWRMKDGSEKYLKKEEMVALNLLLQQQKQDIDATMRKIRQNNYVYQKYFSQKDLNPELKIYSEQQATVGSFCLQIFKMNQSYLINYLNKLIHGINKALKNFQKFQRANQLFGGEFYIQFNDIEENNRNPKQLIAQKLQSVLNSQKNFPKELALSETPQLITFKIGDLMRCKCTSKESQIITLYKIIQYLSFYHPEFIKILKVRNKLDQGNRDILMNILYRQSMVIEMQLAIKTDKSKFIQCSNKFNHFFYEMKRAQFGPIMEMCSIWASQDLRASFFMEKNQDNNQRRNKQNISGCCLNPQNFEMIHLPFKCQKCSYFYFECNFYQKHSKCKACKISTCFMCQFQQMPTKQKLQIFPEFKEDKDKQIVICKNLPLNGAKLLNLNSKKRRVKIFKPILFNNEYFLFHYDMNGRNKKQLEIIEKIKQKQLAQIYKKFSLNNLILDCSSRDHEIFGLDKKKAEKQYFIPNYFEEINATQKVSAAMIKMDINDHNINPEQTDQKVYKSLGKMNFSQNSLKSIKNLDFKFPNAHFAVLNDNQITSIGEIDISNWKKSMSHLYLQNNHIVDASAISFLTQLIQINLNHNNIQRLPQNSFTKLDKLKQFHLLHNKLETLPNSIGKAIKLVNLDLTNNSLTQLPKQIGKLVNLTKFSFPINMISDLPDQIGDLTNLAILNIHNNRLTGLPNSLGKLQTLKILDASNCRLQKLPGELCDLISLTILDIWNNDLTELPQNFGNLENLLMLNVSSNKLPYLPQSLCNISKMEKLDANDNLINHLPSEMNKMHNLRTLHISSNKITALPIQMSKLQNLQSLFIENNKIKQFPKQLSNLYKLNILQMEQNDIRSLDPQFTNLSNLSVFGFDTKIPLTEIINFVINIPGLRRIKLYLSENQQQYATKLEQLCIDKDIEVLQYQTGIDEYQYEQLSISDEQQASDLQQI